MFQKEFAAVANTARTKMAFLNHNPAGYFILSMMAGAFIGFGGLLAFTAGGILPDFSGAKLVMGACFGVALSLVVMAGGELFTGNNMVMAAGVLKRTVSVKDALFLWGVCWIGNLVGAIVLAVLYYLTGLGNGDVGAFIARVAFDKMSQGPVELFTRGILCNMLVCLAVWMAGKMQTEGGKLTMIFWCLLTFFTAGFEHSIANMTIMSIALINPMGVAVSLGGWAYNLLVVTLGNVVGGVVFVAVPYYLASKE